MTPATRMPRDMLECLLAYTSFNEGSAGLNSTRSAEPRRPFSHPSSVTGASARRRDVTLWPRWVLRRGGATNKTLAQMNKSRGGTKRLSDIRPH